MGCSHHLRESLIPGLRSTARHKSMMGQVTMYCATVFWRRAIFTPIWAHARHPKNRQTARWWNPARAFSRWGFTTYVSDPNKSTACTTATYNLTAVLLSAPSIPNILTIFLHFPCSPRRFCSTAGQLLSVDDRMRPNYLNKVTAFNSVPYSENNLPVCSSVFATTYFCHFLSNPRRHISEVRCARLSASCGTNMSHWGHRGWG